MFRKVQVLLVPDVHVDSWGTYVTTPIVKPNRADVRIRTTIKNVRTDSVKIELEQTILNPAGRELAKSVLKDGLKGNQRRELEINLSLIDPERWDIQNPVLYTAITMVFI